MIIVVLGLCSTDEECEKDMMGYRCYSAKKKKNSIYPAKSYCQFGCVCPWFAIAG